MGKSYALSFLLLAACAEIAPAPSELLVEESSSSVATTAFNPNDPLLPQQWHYNNIKLRQAWEMTTGSPGIRIAILDSGRLPHLGLNPKWVAGVEYDAVRQDTNATNPGMFAHGMHVAGIAAGRADDFYGTIGVCPGCQLINVAVAEPNNFPLEVSAARGIMWAVDNGANVINMSFGSGEENLPCSDAKYTALRNAIAYALNRNVTLVAAAGNYGRGPVTDTRPGLVTVPASCPGVISVGATDRLDALASYSNYSTPTNQTTVTLVAPGGGGTMTNNQPYGAGIDCPADPNSNFTPDTEGVLSSWNTSDGTACHRYMSGTSMAAPHVAGVIGLMLSRNPLLTPDQIKQKLTSTVKLLPSCSGKCGAGLLDAAAAVAAAAPLPVNDTPPYAQFTATCDGLDCFLDGSSSLDDRGIVAYQWILPGTAANFNGQPASTEWQQVRYGSSLWFTAPGYGGHYMYLRVFDASGQSHQTGMYVNAPVAASWPQQGSYVNIGRQGASSIELHPTTNGNWVLSWVTFEPDANGTGQPVWYNSAVGPISGSRFSQPLYRYRWNGSTAVETVVGSINIDFSGGYMWVSWKLNGTVGGERYILSSSGDGRTGLWFAPSQPGWGVNVRESSWYFNTISTFYLNGEPRWMRGSAYTSADVTMTLEYVTGDGLCPSCGAKGFPVRDQAWYDLQPTMRVMIANGSTTTGYLQPRISRPGYSVYPPVAASPIPASLLTKP